MNELTFQMVSATNRARCRRRHPGFPNDGWTGADWANAMQGEAGEAGNVVKKLRRIEFGLQQAAGGTRADLLAALAVEIGDTFIYLDLLAQHYGLTLADCVVATFNRVSIREGFPERLPTGAETPTEAGAEADDARRYRHALDAIRAVVEPFATPLAPPYSDTGLRSDYGRGFADGLHAKAHQVHAEMTRALVKKEQP
jgi:hypothetical protein